MIWYFIFGFLFAVIGLPLIAWVLSLLWHFFLKYRIQEYMVILVDKEPVAVFRRGFTSSGEWCIRVGRKWRVLPSEIYGYEFTLNFESPTGSVYSCYEIPPHVWNNIEYDLKTGEIRKVVNLN